MDTLMIDGSVLETVIVIKWEDTMYPTSWLHSFRDADSPRTLSPIFSQLRSKIHQLLKSISSMGTVYLTTSTSPEFVQDCVNCFLPSLIDVLPPFLCHEYFSQKNNLNLILIGDFDLSLFKAPPQASLQILKLVRNPSLEELFFQLSALISLFSQNPKKLDLEISKLN